jgi:hypothetical protein
MLKTRRASPSAWGCPPVMLLIGSVVLIGSLVLAAAPEGPSGGFPRSPLGAPFEPSASKPWVLKGWKDKGELPSETGMWNGLPSGRIATQEECREELHAKASPIYTKLTQLAKNNPQLTITVNSRPDAVSWTTVQTVGRSRTTSEYHVVCYMDQD